MNNGIKFKNKKIIKILLLTLSCNLANSRLLLMYVLKSKEVMT